MLSLDRVPGCDVYRAGDGVHAAWLQRRSRFEPAWKSRLRVFNLKHAALLALERQVFKSVRLVIANSHMVADRRSSNGTNFRRSRIRIIPNGIGVAIPRIPRQEARERLEVPDEAFCVLFVGTGWERKGLRFAIEAVELLRDDALLLVAGRGNPSRYRSARARFLGAVKDLAALYSAADVFVLPTIYDPFSNACLEAVAAGLPVITTTANGLAEILTPGVHGDIVEPGDGRALAAALEAWKERDSAKTAADCLLLAKEYSLNAMSKPPWMFSRASLRPESGVAPLFQQGLDDLLRYLTSHQREIRVVGSKFVTRVVPCGDGDGFRPDDLAALDVARCVPNDKDALRRKLLATSFHGARAREFRRVHCDRGDRRRRRQTRK